MADVLTNSQWIVCLLFLMNGNQSKTVPEKHHTKRNFFCIEWIAAHFRDRKKKSTFRKFIILISWFRYTVYNLFRLWTIPTKFITSKRSSFRFYTEIFIVWTTWLSSHKSRSICGLQRDNYIFLELEIETVFFFLK